MLRHGVLVECADTGSLFTNPQEEYTRLLIDAVPVPAFAA
ncbi:MAG: ABC transporter ATP-binding protein [Pseudoclavibacter sp.]